MDPKIGRGLLDHPPELHLPDVFQPWYILRSLKTTIAFGRLPV